MWKNAIRKYNRFVENFVEKLVKKPDVILVVESESDLLLNVKRLRPDIFNGCNRHENSTVYISTPYTTIAEYVSKLAEVNVYIRGGRAVYKQWAPVNTLILSLSSLFVTDEKIYIDEFMFMLKFQKHATEFIELYEKCLASNDDETCRHNAIVLSGFVGQLRATLSDLIIVQETLLLV